jgi:Cu/Ag efflux pump CusA
MLRSIVSASVRLRLLVVLAAAVLLAIGASEAQKAPVDVLPEFSAPVVEIQTESLGLSAPEVEQLITYPMEQSLLNGIEGAQTIRSHSVPGVSVIDLTFARGSDIYKARQLVQERLTQIGILPNVLTTPPAMRQPVSSTNRVMAVGLTSSKINPIDLSVQARWTIRPRLLGLPGVANVAIWGLRDRQLQVVVDPKRLHRNGISLAQIISTVGNSQLVSPLSYLTASTPGAGGFVDGPSQRLTVRHVLPFGAPSTLGEVPVDNTHGVKLSDVTRVEPNHPPLIGDAVVGGGRGLMLVVEKLPGASTVKVTNEVQRALRELNLAPKGIHVDTSIFKPASYIHTAESNLTLVTLLGGLLLILTVAAFVLRWRTVLVSAVAVTASMLAAAAVLYFAGETLNAMVAAGLLIALAVVVDDAVGDSLAISRRLEQRRARGKAGMPGAIVDAATEMRSSLSYATLIVLLAVAPVFVATGLSASFVRPMALSFVIAVVASMVVALTVTPALSALLAARASKGQQQPRATRLGQRARALYEGVLARAIRMPRALLLVACAAGLIGLAVVPWLREPGPPSFKDRNVLVQFNTTPGTSLTEIDRLATRTARAMKAIPGVKDVGANLGRAVTGDQIVGTNSGELWVTMKDSANYDATLNRIDAVANGVPGVDANVRTYENDRMAGVLSRPGDHVRVRLYGQNYQVLAQKAGEVRRMMSRIDGVKAPETDRLTTQPTFQVRVKLGAALAHGLKPGDVRRAAGTLTQGLVVGDFFDQQKVFEVVVLGKPSHSPSIDQLRNLRIDTPNGGQVPLGSLANITLSSAPLDIKHDAVSRYVDVTAAVSGRAVGAVRADVQRQLKNISFPLEYHASVSGGPSAHTTHARFASFVVAAALGIFLLLQAAFGSWRLAILLLTLLPLALSGGVLVALVAGSQHSLGAYAGLLAVFCIAARHGIMLLKRIEAIADELGPKRGAEAAHRAALERVVPTAASATATLAALVPFMVMGDQPGNEITHEMAAVIAGGLVTSTILVLLVVPAAYSHLRLARVPGRIGRRTAAMPATSIALLALLVVLSGCSDSKSSASTAPASKVVSSGGKKTIVLSPTAAKRLGVQTAVVRTAGSKTKVPYDAVLYEPDGKAIVYTSPAPLRYQRASITVARFKGQTALLRSGPPKGTRVVTVGGDEILGVEQGVAGEG